MTKALVTGATGFTGSHLVRRLLRDGYQVQVLARPTSDYQWLRELGCQVVLGSITEPEAVGQAVRGCDLVFHVATALQQISLSDQQYHATNVGGTKNVLEAAAAERVKRVIHISTVGVHGDVEQVPATEDSPYNPGDIYQRTKLEAEKMALEYFRSGRVPGVVIRPVGIYGPGDRRLLKLFKAVARKKFVFLGRGEIFYHLTFIDDLIDGIMLAADSPQAPGQAYIIAGEKYTTLRQLTELLAEIFQVPPPRFKLPPGPVWLAALICEVVCKPFGIEPPIFRRRLDVFLKNRAFSIAKAQRELGYQPQVDLAAGLRRTAEWYREKGWI